MAQNAIISFDVQELTLMHTIFGRKRETFVENELVDCFLMLYLVPPFF